MQLPGFLRQDPSEGPELPVDRASNSYAARGCIIGCFVALFFWLFPVPVAMIVWVFDLKGPFGDYMLRTMPFFLTFPSIGALIGDVLGRRRSTKSCHR